MKQSVFWVPELKAQQINVYGIEHSTSAVLIQEAFFLILGVSFCPPTSTFFELYLSIASVRGMESSTLENTDSQDNVSGFCWVIWEFEIVDDYCIHICVAWICLSFSRNSVHCAIVSWYPVNLMWVCGIHTWLLQCICTIYDWYKYLLWFFLMLIDKDDVNSKIDWLQFERIAKSDTQKIKTKKIRQMYRTFG